MCANAPRALGALHLILFHPPPPSPTRLARRLQDNVRTSAYHQAITANAADFAGKVVVDVGTGSGILALFAAAAGARKVYALEASDSAARARMLVAANGLSHIIEVIQCKVEEVTLPEKADIIVSEPM